MWGRANEQKNHKIATNPTNVPSKETLLFAKNVVERSFGAGEPSQFQHVSDENLNLTLQEELDLILQKSESQTSL